jgi:hypothetical protein
MKKLHCIILIFAVLSALVLPACNNRQIDALRAATEASYRLPAALNDLIADIEKNVADGTFSNADGRKFGGLINPVAKASVVYVGLVKAANALNDERVALTAKADKTEAENNQLAQLTAKLKTDVPAIRSFFDLKILGPFLDIFEQFKLLSPENRALIELAITAVAAILRRLGGSGVFNLDAAKKLPADIAARGVEVPGRPRLTLRYI